MLIACVFVPDPALEGQHWSRAYYQHRTHTLWCYLHIFFARRHSWLFGRICGGLRHRSRSRFSLCCSFMSFSSKLSRTTLSNCRSLWFRLVRRWSTHRLFLVTCLSVCVGCRPSPPFLKSTRNRGSRRTYCHRNNVEATRILWFSRRSLSQPVRRVGLG